MNGAETQLNKSQKTMLIQGSLSSALFSIGTGNFLAGYLTYLGAAPAFCAIVGAMPQLGCIMQLVSPFFFERMRNRKLLICVCCFVFRIGMGLAGLIPFMLSGKSARLGAVFALYLLAFLMAGFVTGTRPLDDDFGAQLSARQILCDKKHYIGADFFRHIAQSRMAAGLFFIKGSCGQGILHSLCMLLYSCVRRPASAA